MLEAVRRLLTLVLLLAAVWTWAYCLPDLVQVHPLDFAAERQRLLGGEAEIRRLLGPLLGAQRLAGLPVPAEARVPLPEFSAARLKGRQVVPVAGADWQRFFDQAFATAAGRPPDRSWLLRYGTGGLRDYLYFSASEPPLAALGASLPERGQVVYARLGEGDQARYLVLDHLRLADAASQVRSAIRNPYHFLTLWLVLAALLVYVLLPRARAGADDLIYARANSVVAPDWLGLFLSCSFFAIALLALSSDANLAPTLEQHGWAAVTAWCLLLCVPGLSILAVAHWYASFSLCLHEKGFVLRTLLGTRSVDYATVERVGVYQAGSPTWLKVLAVLMAPASIGMAIPLLILTFRTYPGLEITCRDGRVVRLLVSYLPGFERLLLALRAAGATLTPELAAVATDAASRSAPPRPSSSGRVLGRVVLTLLLVALAATATYRQVSGHYPGAAALTVPERAMTDAELAASKWLAGQMAQAYSDLQAATERYEQAKGSQERSAAHDAMIAATERFEVLSREDDRLHERARGQTP